MSVETSSVVALRNGESEVMLCPDIGASIARYTWRGRDILRRASDAAVAGQLVRQMGVYPLVPYSNRIGNAKLIVGDQSFMLRPNFSPEPHAVHGFAWQCAWQLVASDGHSAELSLQHSPDIDWPFACETTEVVQLAENSLKLALAVKNTDHRPMPAGLGFHPYFPLTHNTQLQSEWRGVWKMGADSLPTELMPVPHDSDFRELRSVNGWKIDNCFTDWQRRALLDYGTHVVKIEANEACRNIVVYAPNDGRNFIALEPVTNINNAFALEAKGVADTGMRMLAPGESFAISMSISVDEHA
jgi:aldose 1-epimerase